MNNLSQDNRRFMSKQININHFAVPNRVKKTVQTLSRRSDSLLEGGDKYYLRKSLTLPWTRKLSESNSRSVLSVTLIIKLEGHLVFMVAIQCFAKGDLYLLEVYPPKDFSYHLLTKYHHQYLKDGVVNNFAVKLGKSSTPEIFQEC